MLIWTRWGIAIPFLGYLGALIGNYLALTVGQQIGSNEPWLMAAGWGVGAIASSLLIRVFRDWRETRGGEPGDRTLIHQATGERIVAPSVGDTFFWIHTRNWIWLSLVAGVVGAAVTIYQKIPLQLM